MSLCRPYLLQGIPAWIVMCGITVAGLLPAWVTGRIVDELVRADQRAIATSLGIYAAAVVLGALGNYLFAYLATRLREEFACGLRRQMADAVYSGEYGSATKIAVGELGNRLGSDIDAVCQTLQYSFFPLISACCQFVLTLAVLVAIDWRLAVISLVAVALLWIPTRPAAARYGRFRTLLSEARDRLEARIVDSMSPAALSLVKRSGTVVQEQDRIGRAVRDIAGINVRTTVVGGRFSVLSNVMTAVGPIATLIIGSKLVAHHDISVGLLVAALTYQMRLYSPASTMWGMQSQLATLAALLSRVFNILDIEPERSGHEAPASAAVRLTDVRVEREDATILDGVTLFVREGAHAAMIGPTGCGKSTIVMLLAGLLKPTAGEVCIGGVPVPRMDLGELRRRMAVVAQDEHIFDDTLRANLRYGSDAADEEIDAVIGALGLQAVEDRHGAQTLGVRGHRISGGERQRVALGRALLRRPSVLVLDEATSALDADTERRALDFTRECMRGKTLVLVTHRLANVTGLDQIIVMRRGGVVASGTHDALRSASPYYRHLLEEALVGSRSA